MEDGMNGEGLVGFMAEKQVDGRKIRSRQRKGECDI